MGQQKSNRLAHYAEITTIHGIKDLVFSRSRFMRLAWSLCLIATLGLLCYEIYGTVQYYLSGPTTMIPSTVRLETYPPIHVCFVERLNSTQAGSCNFTDDEIKVMQQPFNPDPFNWIPILRNKTASYQSAMKGIKDKMKQYNWSSFQDVISILSRNVSVKNQRGTATIQKRLLWNDGHAYLCQSISNVSQNEDLEIKFPRSAVMWDYRGNAYIVVGEDLFGEKFFLSGKDCINPNVKIQGIKKRILLNRPGFECTHDYNSAQACLLDCRDKLEACNCNDTESTIFYDYIERFWRRDVFGECNESLTNSSCNQSYDYCTAQCKPCITWNYHSTLNETCIFTPYKEYQPSNLDSDISLRFTRVPMMEVSEQAYSYTASSMLSYIGGLLGLFCGASVLSFVQVFLFWWGDGCHIGTNKVKETVVEDAAKQDNIQSWVEQAALHMPHCKLCSDAIEKNIQSQRSEEAQTSQQKTNHLANYANNTTIHGIRDFLFMKNKVPKLVWGLFLLAVASLMCEEVYRTVINYIQAPTARIINYVRLDKYPTIHICSDTWYNDTLARSYGFTEEDLAFIRLAFREPTLYWDEDMWMMIKSLERNNTTFQVPETPGVEDMWIMMKSIDENNTAFEEQKKSVQLKMEQHSLKTVRDMLNLITWNLSIQGQEFVTSKRWRGRVMETDNSTYVCHSVSNASAQYDLSITLPGGDNVNSIRPDEFIVVGEDPFGESIKYGYTYYAWWTYRQITLKIWEINKRSLVGKDGVCNQGYNSLGVCLQDCGSKKDLCRCNGTMREVSYENNEDFFLLASRHDCRDDASCNQTYDRCVEMREPCTTWDYLVQKKPDGSYDPHGPLNITMVSHMKASQEYYAFLVPSLLSNIGSLMGLFCGASVLSLVQLLLFWWDDGCKAKGTKKNNTENRIKAWLQETVLRIPQCKLCKKLISKRTQKKQGGKIKTSQQNSNHLANYANNTTIHGIKDLLFCKNKLTKLAWGLMLLVLFCLMCEEIYRTLKHYADSPTDIDESIMLLDKYPPVHVCINSTVIYNDIQASSYGFDEDETEIIWSVFNGSRVDITDTQRASIKSKMKQHNLSTVWDMLNIVTVNVSIAEESILPDDPIPQKRWRRGVNDYPYSYVCYTFSYCPVRDNGLIIALPYLLFTSSFVVIGEDPFGLSYHFDDVANTLEVLIRESSQLSVINKGGTCSDDYNSSGVCLQDCVSKESACNSNYPDRLPSYNNTETFWLLDDPADYANITCQHNHEDCTAKCKLIPCTTWTYQHSAILSKTMISTYDWLFKLNIINPIMTVSKEVYTYPASSLLANIGGLVSLFCGGSVLSIVQVILFWWGDGSCRRKGTEKNEGATVISEDDLHKWIHHAARHRT